MRYAALMLLALAGCAVTPPPPKVDGMQIQVPQSRVEECKAQGGCGLVSRSEMVELAQRAFALGAQQASQAAAEGLDSQGCRRGMT